MLKPSSFLAAACSTAALLIFAGGATAAELNAVRGAHVSASSYEQREILFDAGDDLPRNAADADPDTAWAPASGATGHQWIKFDFTRPWPMRYVWTRLVTKWETPPVSFRWQASRDGKSWVTVVNVSSPAEEDAQTVSVSAPYLRILLPKGETGRLTEAEAYSSSGGSGRLEIPTVEVNGNVAQVEWDTSTQSNVFLYRLLRVAELPVQGGNSASMISLLAEAPIGEFVDRVEFPDLTSLDFDYSWVVEAYAPNGERIQGSKSTARLKITQRSPKPFEMRGIIEGYYGPPFSWEDREMLVRFTGLQGGNFYLYGPKLDPYHRAEWREPYPEAFLTKFEELISVGESHSVRVAWSLSPGLDYDGSQSDKEAALAKYQALFNRGVRWFGLFFDDIEADADVTEATQQVELANFLYTELRKQDPDIGFLFVPTVYSGNYDELTAAQQRYLEGLRNLHPNMLVMWTGPGIFSETIDKDDTTPIFEAVQHTLILWDNFPVSDTILGRRIHLGPVQGRSPTLPEPTGSVLSVGGLLANPLWQAPLNRLPLTSVFAYLRDPADYDGDAAIREAISREAPDDVAATFEKWVLNFSTNDLIGAETNEAYDTVTSASLKLENGELPDEAFFRHAANAYIMEAKLKRLHNPDLAGALAPFAKTTAAYGEAEMLLLQALNGTADASAALETAKERLDEAVSLGWIANRAADAELLSTYLAAPPSVSGQGPEIRGSLPSRLTIAEPYSARFAVGDAAEVEIVGLQGARIQSDGRFSWTPRRTGKERWALIAQNESGTSVLYGELDVIAQKANEEGGCQSGGDTAPVALFLVGMAVFAARRKNAQVRSRFTHRAGIK